MTFGVPNSSSPSTPEQKVNRNKDEIQTNFSTTPIEPPPSSPDINTSNERPPVRTNFIPISASLFKPISYPTLAENASESPSIREPNNLEGQVEYDLQSKWIEENPRDNSESEGDELDLEPGDHELPDSEKSHGESNNPFDGENYLNNIQEDEDSSGLESDYESGRSVRSQNTFELQHNSLNLLEKNKFFENDWRERNIWQNTSSPAVYKYRNIAKSMTSSMAAQLVEECDDIILATEAITLKLYNQDSENENDNDSVESAFKVSNQLIRLWETYYKQSIVYPSEEYVTNIGPDPQASNFVKANFLASLALRIHHPRKIPLSFTTGEITLPQTLIEWMDEYHNPYPNQHEEILSHKPSPASHSLFWDSIFNCLIRGKVKVVIDMMKNAGWEHTRNEVESSRAHQIDQKYSDITLANVERAMEVALHQLMKCPAIHEDWNSRNDDWKLFRLRALQALEDLKGFNEGKDFDLEVGNKMIVEPGTFNEAAMKARSLIPWNLYQSLITLYNLLIGDMSTILANSQDWCEATIGLVVWWDEGKREQSLTLNRFHLPNRFSSKYSTNEFFHHKLRVSLEAATSEFTDFQINSADEFQVALASVFEGDSESVIDFLRCWSGPVSYAVAEIASHAGWLPRAQEKSLIEMGSFDQDDFDLLGINHSSSKVDDVKDKTLITYANNLSKRNELVSSVDPETRLSSWEVSIAIFGRLDSAERSSEIIQEFLQKFPLEESSTVNRLWILLNNIGLTSHAESAAQRYADDLAENSHKYGEALYYYALAHNTIKVRNVLDLLISSSLIQSSAYPPEEDLDDHLRSLITNPQLAMTEITKMDVEAARLLHKSLSGYATLRKFYHLRDEYLMPPTGKTKMSAKSRKLQASIALIAVITSSGDHIRGGLYDIENDAVVHVDFLLALLGEALIFINQPDFTLTVSQIETLLYIIEDLHYVPSRVYKTCDRFLHTVLTSYQDHKNAPPLSPEQNHTQPTSSSLHKTSNSRPTGSSILTPHLKPLVYPSENSAKNTRQRRWHWREELPTETTGDDLLKLLRLSLAKDLAKAWLMEIDQKL